MPLRWRLSSVITTLAQLGPECGERCSDAGALARRSGRQPRRSASKVGTKMDSVLTDPMATVAARKAQFNEMPAALSKHDGAPTVDEVHRPTPLLPPLDVPASAGSPTGTPRPVGAAVPAGVPLTCWHHPSPRRRARRKGTAARATGK